MPPLSHRLRTIRHHASLFWIIALLLLVGGQVAHASLDAEHHEDHCNSQHTDAGKPSPEPAKKAEPHHCCHTHSPATSVVSDDRGLATPHLRSGSLPVINDFAPEQPVREIDHPPQLS